MRIVVLITAFALVACHGKQIPAHGKYEIINRGKYAYQRLNDGTYTIEVANQSALQEALTEIGCGRKFICLVEREGEMFNVQQRSK